MADLTKISEAVGDIIRMLMVLQKPDSSPELNQMLELAMETIKDFNAIIIHEIRLELENDK